MLRCLVLGSRVSCLRTAWGVGRKPKEVSGSCQKHAGMAKCYLRQGYGVFMTRVSGGRCPRSTPEPPRSLAVVPLIGDKRYYGEAPVGLAGGLREGLVRGRRNWGPEVRLSKSEFRRPKPERRPNTEGRSHAWAFRLSGFGLLSALGFRASGLDLCAHGLALLSRYARARGASGARHAECCVWAYDDLANLLGWHLLGLLSGILERRGPPSAVHGRPNDARERNCFDARYCCCVGECEDGVPIC